MDKSKISIPRLSKKATVVNNVMNLHISFTGVLTHGENTRGFGHFSLSLLEMGSNFTITSLYRSIRDLEEPIVDLYGDLPSNKGTLKHPLNEALSQCESYEKCQVYRKNVMV